MNSSLQRLTEAPDKFSPPPRSSTLVQDDVMTQFNMLQVGVSEQDEHQSASSSLSGDGEDEDEKEETGDSKSSAASTGDRRHGDTLSDVDLVEDDLTKEKFRRLQHIFYKVKHFKALRYKDTRPSVLPNIYTISEQNTFTL